MQAVIQKLELKKILNRYYIRIELLDEDGVIRVLDNPFLSDNINFRKQVFGILSSCDNFDLMKLATDNPIPRKTSGYYQNGLQILENENGEWFNLNKKTGLYMCQKPKQKTHDFFDNLVSQSICNVRKDEGIIEMMVSQSGTFQLLFTCNLGSAFYTTGQIYYGFGYPLTIGGSDANPRDIAYSAKMFTSFIVSLMRFYGVNDMLDFGGNKNNLPVVEIVLNEENKITTITNPINGMGLKIDTEYSIVNIFELDKAPKKKLDEKE